VPGIAESFALRGPKPIIVKKDPDRGDTYLLTDQTQKSFCLWNEYDGRLWWFKTKGLEIDTVVSMVQQDRYSGKDLSEQFPTGPPPAAPPLVPEQPGSHFTTAA
jgi:hypothetical protein